MSYRYLRVSSEEIAAIEAAGLTDLAARLRAEMAAINSVEADMCRANARDDESFTPELDGPVSFCEDGKAWVMTWELVDGPNADLTP